MDEPISLEDTQAIGPATATKLRKIGIEALVVTPVREITDKTDIGPDEAFQIVAKARKIVRVDWITAQELYERRKDLLGCSTSSEKTDVLPGECMEAQVMMETQAKGGTRQTKISAHPTSLNPKSTSSPSLRKA